MELKYLALLCVFVSVHGAPQRYDADGLLCEMCHIVVKDLGNLVGQNATQETIKNQLDDICKRLTANNDVCLNFVKQYAPTIFNTLKNGLDPEAICKLLDVCPAKLEAFGRQESEPLITYEEKPKEPDVEVDCKICKLLVTELDSLIQDERKPDVITDTLNKLCIGLPDSIKDICEKHSEAIVDALANGLKADTICKSIELCDKEKKPQLIERQSEVVDPEPQASPVECEICKLLVTEIDNYIEKNSSKEAINTTVYNVCEKLPSALKTFCLMYAPNLVQTIAQGFSPSDACVKAKLCDSGVKESLDRSFDLEANPLECEICKLLIEEAEKYLITNSTVDTLNDTLNKFCESLPAELKSFCTQYEGKIVEAILAGITGDKICEIITLCSAGSTSEKELVEEVEIDVPEADACDVCEFVINLIDQEIANNASAEKINSTVYGLCNLLPTSIKDICTGIAPTLVKEIEGGFDPEQACTALGLCTKAIEVSEDSIAMPEKIRFDEADVDELKDAKCDVCQFLIGIIDQQIAKNASEKTINDTMYSLCDLLPEAIKVTCYLIAPTIVKEVEGGFDPKSACETLKLCANGTMGYPVEFDEYLDQRRNEAVENENPEEEVGDEKCDLCEVVVNLLDQFILERNSTIADINATVYQICGLLPSTLKSTCDQFAPDVVRIVQNGVEPKKACEFLKLCTNEGPVSQKEIIGLSCSLCQGVVEVILKDKYDPEVALSICHVPCPHIRHRRSAKMVMKVSPNSSGVQTEKKIKLDEDWDCDVCTWLAEAATIFMKDNATEEKLSNNLYTVCKFLPAPYNEACQNTVPVIVKELEHGLEPKKFCIEVMPDDCKNLTKKLKMPDGLMEKIETINKEYKPLTECDVCKAIMATIYNEVDQSSESIQQYFEDVCKHFPDPTSSACEAFADKEMDTIKDKIVNKVLDPTKVCEMVNICKSSRT